MPKDQPDQLPKETTEAAEALPDHPGFLVRKCEEEEGFMIGDDIEVRVYRIMGSKVVLAVRAPRDVKIKRAPPIA